MSEKSMKKEFHMEIDDLVDALLQNLNSHGWNLGKMQYELGTLTAGRSEKVLDDGKAVPVKFELVATWQDFGDALELEVVVKDPEHDWTDGCCAQKCATIIDSIEDRKSYENLYSENTDFVFDDFESNNN
jgi:hypothetical protein